MDAQKAGEQAAVEVANQEKEARAERWRNADREERQAMLAEWR